jgi:glycosyltransferase involved in cell wall biosynthesis
MLSYTSAVIIALDATPLTVPTGGVARYTSELACALAARFPENEYWLLSDRPFPMPYPRPTNPGSRRLAHPDLHLTNLKQGDPPRTFLGRRWWSVGLLREMKRRGADLFHGTDFSTPYVPLRPSVMTVHDLSPWLHELEEAHALHEADAKSGSRLDRPWQPDSARVRSRTAMLLRLRVPTMVITPTEAIRRAVIARFRLPGTQVVAVPLAASEHFRPIACPPPATPYFLFVGTLEPRKNISGLIDAWREVRQTHNIDLVIAGRARADFAPLAAETGLRVLGPVPDEDLPELYSNARAVVYPSLYEGFGLPVLEAMQCGALVVTSLDPAIMEVAGDAASFVAMEDGGGTRELAATLASIAEAPHNFAPLRERALRRAKQFSWRRTAELTQEVYAEACRVFRH